VCDNPTLLLGLLLRSEYWCSVEIENRLVASGPPTHSLRQRLELQHPKGLPRKRPNSGSESPRRRDYSHRGLTALGLFDS
jgi:hypothetical protein